MKDIDDPFVQAVKASLDMPLRQEIPTPSDDRQKAAEEGDADAKAEIGAYGIARNAQEREEQATIDAIMASLTAKGESSAAGAQGMLARTSYRLAQVLRVARTSRAIVTKRLASSSPSGAAISRETLVSEMLRFAEQGCE